MDSLLLLSQSPEPQNPISDPANSIVDEFKDESTMKIKTKKKKTKTSNLDKRKLKGKIIMNNNDDEASSSSCCSSSSTSNNPNSTKRVSRVVHRLRNPSVRLGMTRRSVGERQAEALALPLGMSFAAFANLVLERKSVAGKNVYVDDLAMVSASAVTESLANVYGDKLGSFATNFQRSFNSTLRILRLTNESAFPNRLENNNNLDECSDNEQSAKETSSTTSTYEAIRGNATTTTAYPSMMHDLVLHEDSRQLSSIFPRRSSTMPLTTSERSLQEQVRANDLTEMMMGLKVRKYFQEEKKLAQGDESNYLMKQNLAMGAEKAVFQKDKFKTKQEEKSLYDMVTKIMDWLVVNVFIMLVSLCYGAYNFSHERIKEASSICKTSEEKSSSSWFIPKQVSSFNTGFNIWICHIKVWVQIIFGVLMILFLTYMIIQRSSGSKAMPVPFIVLFLGVVCGIMGKLCVDTLGGDGKLWLLLWETFCVLQFVANVFTSALYGLICGPIIVTQGGRVTKSSRIVPYWVRKSFFFGLILFVLPAVNGLLPFASFGEWRDHFGLILYEFLLGGGGGSARSEL